MAWTLGGVRIFVQEHEESNSQILPRLQPLSGGTVIQIFGYESKIVKLNAIVVGDVDRNAIRAMPKTGSNYSLTFPGGGSMSMLVKSVVFKQRPNICQTLRPDLAEDANMYDAAIELYIED